MKKSRKAKKTLTKKAKIIIGTTVPSCVVIIPAVLITILHFVSVAPNNVPYVPGSDSTEHTIEYELTEDEIKENEAISNREDLTIEEINDMKNKDDKYYEETPNENNDVSKEEVKDDVHFNTDTDSNEIQYRKEELQK